MDNKSFWLLDISTSVLSVSLVNYTNDAFVITAIGPRVPFIGQRESIVSAVDSSLSSAAKSASLSEDQEPSAAALILPPFWIGSDGKIVPQFLKLIEYICRDLDFKPMGFIANDEAIVEDANHIDSFPASFVLVNLSENEMFVSLTYLGKVIERISKPLVSPFDPSLLELALIEFKTESTLPPQLIIFGNVDDKIIESIRNYSWVGKKNIETFLHFPDIKTYSASEITQIYTRAITSQFPQPVDTETPDSIPKLPPAPPSTLTEISASDLGFENQPEESIFTSDNLTVPEIIPDIVSETIVESKPIRPKLKIKIPTLPKLHLPPVNFLLLMLVFSPLLILIPFFFSKAQITVYVTPYKFTKQINVTLDPISTSIDLGKNIIPVNRHTINITSTDSLPTTGQVTIGEKSSGEVIIYNQKSSPQKLPGNTILIDNQGNNYVLTKQVEVASSSANLDLGVITLGQIKAGIIAANIGPEFNLPKDTQLHFKDFPETSLIAKVDLPLTGGTKSQASAVSAEDLTNLGKNLNLKITSAIDEKINNEIKNIEGLIQDSVQIKKGRIDYSREKGEQTDGLTATSVSTINVFSISTENRTKIVESLLINDSQYNGSLVDLNNIQFFLTSNNPSLDKVKGQLKVEGFITPQVDKLKIIKLISGKSVKTAHTLIKSQFPQIYNFKITTNLRLIGFINPLPFRISNITVEVK